MAIVTEEGLSKIISIVGTHATDITYYLARTLNAAGTKCLVVDNSRDKYLFRSIPKAQGETMAQTGEIVYVQGVAYSEVFFAQYDFVLIHHGLSMNEELLKRIEDEKPVQTKVTKKEISVDDQINKIREKFKQEKQINFFDLFEFKDKSYLVVTFLAILEMAKNKEIVIKQNSNFATILCEVVE